MTAEPRDHRKRRRIRDIDSADVAFRVKAFGWALLAVIPGAVIGGALGISAGSTLTYAVLGGAGGFALAYFGALAVADRAGRIGSSIYFSSGRTTPGTREYSLAESMIVRGRFDEAVTELEAASARYPADIAPPLRLARLLRDHCGRPDDAAAWFRAAIERSRNDPAAEAAALRELIELYTHVLRTPERALPHLARLAARHPGTASGAWARDEIVSIKRSLPIDDSDRRLYPDAAAPARPPEPPGDDGTSEDNV